MPTSFKAATPRLTRTPPHSNTTNCFTIEVGQQLLTVKHTIDLGQSFFINNILVFLWMSLSIRNLQLSVTHIQILSSLISYQSVSERMRRSNLQPVSQGPDLKYKLVEMTRRTFMRWQSAHRQKVVFKSIYSDKVRSSTGQGGRI